MESLPALMLSDNSSIDVICAVGAFYAKNVKIEYVDAGVLGDNVPICASGDSELNGVSNSFRRPRTSCSDIESPPLGISHKRLIWSTPRLGERALSWSPRN